MAKGRSVRLTRSRPESHFPRHDHDSARAPGIVERFRAGECTALARTLDRHEVYLHHSGELSRRRRAERVRTVVERRLQRLAWRLDPGEEILSESLRASETGELSPYAAAERIVKEPGVHPR